MMLCIRTFNYIYWKSQVLFITLTMDMYHFFFFSFFTKKVQTLSLFYLFFFSSPWGEQILITFKSRIITYWNHIHFQRINRVVLRSDLVHFTMWNIAVICQYGLWSLRGKGGVQTGNELVKHTFCTTGSHLTLTPHPQCGIMTHRNQRGVG